MLTPEELAAIYKREYGADVRPLVDEVERLRKALEFYADASRYRYSGLNKSGVLLVDGDCGSIARQALNGEVEL